MNEFFFVRYPNYRGREQTKLFSFSLIKGHPEGRKFLIIIIIIIKHSG